MRLAWFTVTPFTSAGCSASGNALLNDTARFWTGTPHRGNMLPESHAARHPRACVEHVARRREQMLD
jgi:hypothetical protein